ncbi:UNVERIFIED_ORG: aminoglycoside phosphotransferase family protein [Bacillus sp. AZ43]
MITDLTGTSTWQDAAWRTAALDWAAAELARAGCRLDGEPEQVHVRIWSTAFRLPLRGGGVAWLKSVGAGSAQEPPLAEALGRWVPEHVLVPLAAHRERRLLLLPDGGPTLRDRGADDPSAWAAMLADYARLQIALAPHAVEMVALGVPDHRPELLPHLVEGLLADDEAQLVGRPGGLTDEARGRLAGTRAEYVEACRGLAQGPIPATLQHDDLHDANVFAGGGRHRFFDWGDASVAHPFVSLLVALRMAGRMLAVGNGDPVLHRLRDAYLEVWEDFGDSRILRDQCALALRVAPLARALTWRRILRGVIPEERAEWADSVPGWTAEQLSPGPLAVAPAA